MGLLSIADLSRGELHDLLSTARHLRLHDTAAGSCSGLRFAVLSLVPAFRARVAFDAAIADLGGRTLVYRREDLGESWLRSPADLGRMLSRSVDGVLMFGPDPVLRILAAHATVPVLNGWSERESVVDGLAVLMTAKRYLGHLRGSRLAYIGDGNEVAHAVLAAGAHAAMTVAVAHPRGFAPDPEVVMRARDLAAETGGAILVTEDPAEAVADAQVVLAEPWGFDDDETARRRMFEGHKVDRDLLEQAAPGAVLLHGLPIEQADEVGDTVLDDRWPALLDLAENRVHVARALVLRHLGNRGGSRG